MQAITRLLKSFRQAKKGVSNVIIVMLSLILIVMIVSNVILWSYQMNQLDWEKMQENIEILSVTESADWLSGWNYRKSHVIGNVLGAGTNYQVRITVHYGVGTDIGEHVYLNGHCRTDFGDVRFTENDGTTLLNYWIEEYTSGNQGIFWVKITDNLDNSPTTIYIYYGNPSATSISNGTNTFVFFDDFDDGVIDSTKWTAINSAQESGGTFRGEGGNQMTWARTISTFTANIEVRFRMRGEVNADFDSGIRVGNLYFISDGGTSTPTISTTWAYPSGSAGDVITWHTYKASIRSSSQEFYDITADRSAISFFPYTSGYLYLIGDSDNANRDTFYDWIFVRNYTSPEPSHGEWGNETSIVLTVELRNKSSATIHVISVWIINSTFHKRYDMDFFINSGETASLYISDGIPNNYYIVKVVTEKGNIAIISNP
ncbi:MAG: DUF2341 domain-containing protein [Candidatus Bathyarchaeia archaeon]